MFALPSYVPNMIISINQTGAATLEDIDNFRTFKVAAVCGAEPLAQALTSFGRLDENGYAWISRTWLLAKGRPDDAKWLAGFGAMLDYASAHGWVEQARENIRAHIEYVPS
jgi:hypothetical protein